MNRAGLVRRLAGAFAAAGRAAVLLAALAAPALPTAAVAQVTEPTLTLKSGGNDFTSVVEDGGAIQVTAKMELPSPAAQEQPWQLSFGQPGDTARRNSVSTDYDYDYSYTDPNSGLNVAVLLRIPQDGTESSEVTFSFVPTRDTLDEGMDAATYEKLTIIAYQATLISFSNRIEVTIVDDDDPPTGIKLSLEDPGNNNNALSGVPESAAAQTVTVKATVEGGTTFGTDRTVRVSVGAPGDAAAEGSDYEAVADFDLTIEEGKETGTATFTLAPVPDAVAEGRGGGEMLSVAGALVALTPDEPPVSVAGTRVAILDDVEAAAAARRSRVNEAVLPHVAQAMAASALSAVAGRIEAAGAGPAGRSGLSGALESVARAAVDGRPGGPSFALPLGAAGDGGPRGAGGLAVWGGGDYRRLSGPEKSAVEWDGGLAALHLGADMRIRRGLLAGMAVSRSRGSFDYTDRTDPAAVGGAYRSRMTAVHPYAGWTSPASASLWAAVGYGRGKIEIEDDADGRASSRARMKTAAFGAGGDLLPDRGAPGAPGATVLRLKGEASLARVEVEGSGRIEPLASNVRRLRLSLEGRHERRLASGARLAPSVEVGLRHDGGDAAAGTGLEAGAALRYEDPAAGLTMEARARALAAHEEDYGDWGAGGLVVASRNLWSRESIRWSRGPG